MAKRRYDVGSYDPSVTIDLDKFISKTRASGKGSRDLNKMIQIAINDGLDELARRAEEYAKDKMRSYGITGELYTNLKAERNKGGIQISTYAQSNWGFDYSMYVEFGTGIVGKGKPHPHASKMGWRYTTEHVGADGKVRSGWIYPSHENDVNKNKWIGKDGNWYAFTMGQEARPFMYDTWLYLSRTWHSTLMGYVNRARKEWGESFL